MQKLIKTRKSYKEIQTFIYEWERLKNAYFWSPPQLASSRRSYERQNSMSINVKNNNIHIEGKIDVNCSCRNIYVSKELYINGEKKTIRALKNLL